ncbi:MAG: hypothetical protein ACTSQG_05835 [Promethearchaeota archaeon]
MVTDRCFICGEEVDENDYTGYIFIRATKSKLMKINDEYGNHTLYRVYLCKKHQDKIFDIYEELKKDLEKKLNKLRGGSKWQKI